MSKAISNPCCNTFFRVKASALIVLLSSLFLLTTGQAADSVGILKFAHGTVSIEAASGAKRKAVKGDDLMQNELVETGAGSIAVIELSDDSRMTLRPNSAFRVRQLNMDEDNSNQSSAVLSLLRGGLRLVTGLIGKINPSAYRLSTPVATIGIRGTEFNTRLCSADCAAEEMALADGDAAAKLKEGLYVNVDDGGVALKNFATNEPVNLDEGESGYVADINSLPVKLSLVPAFLLLDKIPSPSMLDFNDIEIPDDALPEIMPEAAAVAGATAAASAEQAAEIDISGTYEIEVEYGKDLPHADRRWFFGSNPDIEFTLTQKGDKIKGEFDGDRDGTIKGQIDDETVTFEFLLEALGGEYKDGAGTWIVQSNGNLEGDFKIRDPARGVVRGRWVLTKTD